MRARFFTVFFLVIITSSFVYGATFVARAPEDFVRATGAPVTLTRTFSVLDPTTTFTIVIQNGGSNNKFGRVSSAVVTLNGNEIVGPSEFNQQVATIQKPVTLQATNTFTVELRGAPGGGFTLEFVGVDNVPPTITASADRPPNTAGWYNTNVVVSFACADKTSGVASCPPPVTVGGEGANQIISGSATDNAGNRATTQIAINLDKTPPVAQNNASPQPNTNGWNNSNVTVTFTGTDTLSGIASCSPAVILASDGNNQSGSGTCTDIAGNTSAVSTRSGINIDKTPPTVAFGTPSPAPNTAGWNNTNVTFSFTPADNLSGVASSSVSSPLLLAAEGSSVSDTVTVTDRADNSATFRSPSVKIDKTPPVITAVQSPSANANGWNNSNVTVSFNATDALSGLANVSSPVTLTNEGANQLVTGNAVDLAGNQAIASLAANIDKTPPSLSVTSPLNGANVFASPLTVRGTVLDALSGVDSISCNGAAASVSGTSLTCLVALAAGSNSINAVATDIAGNSSTATKAVVFSPAPHVTITSPPNLSYFNISPTTVAGTVDDPGATVTVNAVDAVVVNGRFSLALPLQEGPNVIAVTARSSTGAIGTSSVDVTLDTTPPHVTITSPPDRFVTTDSSISVSGNINDIVVGTVNDQQASVTVNGVTGQVANRTFVATNVPLSTGDNVIQATGRDRVGNFATTQITVTRQAPISQAQIRLVSGNNQTGIIGSIVAAPLVVALTDSAGNPALNKPVIFRVTQNNGMVGAGGAPSSSVVATTNAQGQAQVQWTLGMRAGAGSNSLEAYAVGFGGTAIFTGTGTLGPAGKIVVDAGNHQIGAIGQAVPKPLIAVVIDGGNNRLGGVPVTFTVKSGGGSFDSQPTSTVTTDSDGRAAATLTLGVQEGNDNNLVEATFPANQGFPTAFTASGRAAGDPARTTISGVVLDNSNIPIPGVTIRAVLTNVLNSNATSVQSAPAVQTNAQGQFSITPAPIGLVKLVVDGSTAQRAGTYPSLEYDMVTVAGQTNTVGNSIYLLPLNSGNQRCVTATTGGGTLTMPDAPGFSLTFGPGQVTFPGGSRSGCVSVTVVHGDKVPMAPGFGQQPRFIVTIQPAGAIFNPPAPITLPNVDGLKPRAVTEMYSFDHDIGSFVAIGTGVVSDDGQVIRSSAGVGVLKAGWHCGGDPNANGSVADCPDCQICQNDQCMTDASQNGTDPRDSNFCCFQGEKLDKFGQTVGYIFPGPLENKCPDRTQNDTRLHESDGCTAGVPPNIQDPMQNLPYPFGLLNQAPTAFGQDLRTPSNPAGTLPDASAAGPLPCNQHDICYQTCAPPGADLSSTRQACDDGMKGRMDSVCSAAYPSTCPSTLSTGQCVSYFLQRLDCFTYSGLYWGTLRAAGFFAAYKGRQEQYCKCCS